MADEVIEAIGKAKLGVIDGVTLSGLSSLRREKCELKVYSIYINRNIQFSLIKITLNPYITKNIGY